MDGSVRGEVGHAGIGGVLCNSSRAVLCSFSESVRDVSVATAELLAILKACRLCASKASLVGRKILIESDSRLAVSWVNDENFGHLSLVNTIYALCCVT